MATASLSALCDATVFTGDAFVEGHTLLLKNGKVLDIITNSKIPADAVCSSLPDLILAPGFIDTQVNGGDNILFNNTPTVDACHAIARAHARYGTTRLLITCITDTPKIMRQALVASREARKTCPNILGIHLEGPHLGQSRRGVHKANYIRPTNAYDLLLYKPEHSEVMLITLAPETVDADIVQVLHERGILISIGHTSALPEQIHKVIEAGARGFTHLFNGMGKPTAEGTTPADTALNESSAWCGMIMDGFHVPNDMARLAFEKKPEKIFLVSDAMPPAASATPQPFELYGEKINVANGRCFNNEGKLAGSSITLLDAVRHCVKNVGVPIEEALRMASFYPACFLGLEKRFGKLLPGYEADVLALTPEMKLNTVYVSGTHP